MYADAKRDIYEFARVRGKCGIIFGDECWKRRKPHVERANFWIKGHGRVNETLRDEICIGEKWRTIENYMVDVSTTILFLPINFVFPINHWVK